MEVSNKPSQQAMELFMKTLLDIIEKELTTNSQFDKIREGE